MDFKVLKGMKEEIQEVEMEHLKFLECKEEESELCITYAYKKKRKTYEFSILVLDHKEWDEYYIELYGKIEEKEIIERLNILVNKIEMKVREVGEEEKKIRKKVRIEDERAHEKERRNVLVEEGIVWFFIFPIFYFVLQLLVHAKLFLTVVAIGFAGLGTLAFLIILIRYLSRHRTSSYRFFYFNQLINYGVLVGSVGLNHLVYHYFIV